MVRNAVMLEETKDTITVPAAFMIRMLACIHSLRNRRGGASTGGNVIENGSAARSEASTSQSNSNNNINNMDNNSAGRDSDDSVTNSNSNQNNYAQNRHSSSPHKHDNSDAGDGADDDEE